MFTESEARARIKKYSDYYIYETHMHTSQGSACARNTGAEMARAAKDYGYTGITITDHFFYGNTAVDRSLPWNQWVEMFCQGYYDAKKTGEEIGLQVFFGWESCYDTMEFLIYGLSPDWLMAHPEIRDCSVKEQYQMIHRDGGVVIQAHPFREADYIHDMTQYPEDVDGVEVLNISNGAKSGYGLNANPWDDKAYEYAKEHGLHMSAGSDVHSTKIMSCGMGFKRRLLDGQDFAKAILRDEGIIMY